MQKSSWYISYLEQILTKSLKRGWVYIFHDNEFPLWPIKGRLRSPKNGVPLLVNVFMKLDEPMLDYISRIKDLRDAIDCDRDNADCGNINNLTTKILINGVTSQAELRAMQNQRAIFDGATQSCK